MMDPFPDHCGLFQSLSHHSADGQDTFLHPITLQMLELDAQLRNEPLAESMSANIVEVETFRQTAQTRKRLPSLAHLPLNGTVNPD